MAKSAAEVLHKTWDLGYQCHRAVHVRSNRIDPIVFRQKATDEALKQLHDGVIELIGPDEVRPVSGPKRNGIDQGLRRTRNKLRAELRTKVDEYFREDNGRVDG